MKHVSFPYIYVLSVPNVSNKRERTFSAIFRGRKRYTAFTRNAERERERGREILKRQFSCSLAHSLSPTLVRPSVRPSPWTKAIFAYLTKRKRERKCTKEFVNSVNKSLFTIFYKESYYPLFSLFLSSLPTLCLFSFIISFRFSFFVQIRARRAFGF